MVLLTALRQLDLRDHRAVDGNRLGAYRRARRHSTTREAVDQALVACLGIGDGVGAAGAGQILAAMLPERFQGANSAVASSQVWRK